MILHASELATELFDEVQSPRCSTFAISIATAKLPAWFASRAWYYVGSPMKKSDFHRSNRTPIQCMQAIDLYVKTTKRAMLTLSFSAEK